MSAINDGGPAFPSADSQHPNGDVEYGKPGMTLRDWFAGQALAGYFANAHTPHQNATDCADYMYRVADAMLKARGGTP
jgi:hypothetical protein